MVAIRKKISWFGLVVVEHVTEWDRAHEIGADPTALAYDSKLGMSIGLAHSNLTFNFFKSNLPFWYNYRPIGVIPDHGRANLGSCINSADCEPT